MLIFIDSGYIQPYWPPVLFLQNITMMFTGGLIVAVAVEHSNLHKRIAVRVLMTVGTAPKWYVQPCTKRKVMDQV